ncbi:MAG: hypothetical protein GX801_06810 [Fibrobacter sp.]|nr:hypothetical protein [Fibrobacter sp.]
MRSERGKIPCLRPRRPKAFPPATSAARSPPPLVRGHPATPREPGGNLLFYVKENIKKTHEKLN